METMKVTGLLLERANGAENMDWEVGMAWQGTDEMHSTHP